MDLWRSLPQRWWVLNNFVCVVVASGFPFLTSEPRKTYPPKTQTNGRRPPSAHSQNLSKEAIVLGLLHVSITPQRLNWFQRLVCDPVIWPTIIPIVPERAPKTISAKPYYSALNEAIDQQVSSDRFLFWIKFLVLLLRNMPCTISFHARKFFRDKEREEREERARWGCQKCELLPSVPSSRQLEICK